MYTGIHGPTDRSLCAALVGVNQCRHHIQIKRGAETERHATYFDYAKQALTATGPHVCKDVTRLYLAQRVLIVHVQTTSVVRCYKPLCGIHSAHMERACLEIIDAELIA